MDELGYEVVGEAECGGEAENLVKSAKPDMLISDLKLPDEDGFEVAKKARAARSDLRIIFMSAYCDAVTVQRIEQARAHGFIDKNYGKKAEFKLALQTVMRGGTYFAQTYKIVLSQLHTDPLTFYKLLTGREQQVIGFIACAMTNSEIAERLNRKASTIETHRRNIMRKLGIDSAPRLIKYAIDHGFVNFLTQVRNPR